MLVSKLQSPQSPHINIIHSLIIPIISLYTDLMYEWTGKTEKKMSSTYLSHHPSLYRFMSEWEGKTRKKYHPLIIPVIRLCTDLMFEWEGKTRKNIIHLSFPVIRLYTDLCLSEGNTREKTMPSTKHSHHPSLYEENLMFEWEGNTREKNINEKELQVSA